MNPNQIRSRARYSAERAQSQTVSQYANGTRRQSDDKYLRAKPIWPRPQFVGA